MTELEQQTRIGKDAAIVLENAAYQQSIKQMHEAINANWRQCDVRDAEGQRLLLQMSKVAALFEANLNGLIERGKFAQNQLDLEKAREPKGWMRKVIG